MGEGGRGRGRETTGEGGRGRGRETMGEGGRGRGRETGEGDYLRQYMYKH